ncbi:alpha/beta hydrolase [Agromyces protaetiae]|uniref:Alpha/beta hydrolase n=1 Tax=Agromyces protaetiae TaxID=2509455 RepID=A0A4V0YGV6_9MICO|nr:alpha/beta hydrolase [Agromyces protaetiae]QAY72541.1 alpha/beta hydrolase [Agromyces protaetiae]
MPKPSPFHPDLRAARFVPNYTMGPRMTRLMRATPPTGTAPDDVRIEEVVVPGPAGAPDIRLRVYDPVGRAASSPALLWIHGGGFLIGSPEQDEASSIRFARELGILVVAARYRLAPEHPSPAGLDDVYAALAWLLGEAEARAVDRERIAIGGASAGGGLAASLALLAHDRGEFAPAFQLLVYPMLDDRTVLRAGPPPRGHRMWSTGSNRYAWTSYLGEAPGGPDVSPYAAPARRADLGGLPPAWIGVGMLDLFHDEDVSYAARLGEAGVPVELEVVEGVFHGFDAVFRKSGVARSFWRSQAEALRRAFAR